jgi:uncharacterized protein YjiK
MHRHAMTAILVALAPLLILAACTVKPKRSESTQPDAEPATTLALYDFAARDPTIVELPDELREVSGFATTADGRLFAHADERGVIVEIDPTSGARVKRFSLGDPAIRGDFEGLAIAGDTFHLIASTGEIYSFPEGADDEVVAFETSSTGLAGYDIEGLCYEPARNALLIACKEMPDDRYAGRRAVLEWSLDRRALEAAPRFLIAEAELVGFAGTSSFGPSGIERHPTTGAFLAIASRGSAIVELSADGRLLGLRELPQSIHPQPEAIAIMPDGTLILGNEGESRGTLVRYPMRHSN